MEKVDSIARKYSEFMGKQLSDEICEIHDIHLWRISRPSVEGPVVQEFCPECQKEAIRKKEDDLLQQSLVNAKLAQTFSVFRKESIISEDLKKANFNSYDTDTEFDVKALNFAKRICRSYYEGNSGNTVLMGVPGVGKSHLSVAMADALNDSFKKAGKPKSILFMPTARLFSKIKSSFNGGGGFTEEYAIDLLTRVNYLFLDDLGKESCMSTQIKPASDWVQGVLFNILDQRQTTVINTNFSRQQLLQIYDAALVDRIFKGSTQNKQILIWPDNSVSKR